MQSSSSTKGVVCYKRACTTILFNEVIKTR
jgi:hypothetical protein